MRRERAPIVRLCDGNRKEESLMARHSLASGGSQFRPASVRPKSKTRNFEISSTLERKWFEFDRRGVTDVLNKLRRSIHDGATQMEMIADEQMFDSSLSRTFSRTARRLDRLVENLKQLGVGVNGATGYPKPQKNPVRDSRDSIVR
jgi:hypothetical protein